MIVLSYLHVITPKEQHFYQKLQRNSNNLLISTSGGERMCCTLSPASQKYHSSWCCSHNRAKSSPGFCATAQSPQFTTVMTEGKKCHAMYGTQWVNIVTSRTIIRKFVPQPLNHWLPWLDSLFLQVSPVFGFSVLVFHLERTQPQIPFHALHCT